MIHDWCFKENMYWEDLKMTNFKGNSCYKDNNFIFKQRKLYFTSYFALWNYILVIRQLPRCGPPVFTGILNKMIILSDYRLNCPMLILDLELLL